MKLVFHGRKLSKCGFPPPKLRLRGLTLIKQLHHSALQLISYVINEGVVYTRFSRVIRKR